MPVTPALYALEFNDSFLTALVFIRIAESGKKVVQEDCILCNVLEWMEVSSFQNTIDGMNFSLVDARTYTYT